MDDFVKALSIADIPVITDIMGSSCRKTCTAFIVNSLHKRLTGRSGLILLMKLRTDRRQKQKDKNFNEIIDYISKNAQEGDLVITLGCGDVYKLAKKLAKRLRESEYRSFYALGKGTVII